MVFRPDSKFGGNRKNAMVVAKAMDGLKTFICQAKWNAMTLKTIVGQIESLEREKAVPMVRR
jgi:hypothetical protein